MIGSSAIGSESVGGFTNNYEFAEIASSEWVGASVSVDVLGATATGEWVAVDGLSKYVYEAIASAVAQWSAGDVDRVSFIIDPATGEFIAGNDFTVGVLGDTADGSWSANDGLITVVIDPATGDWVGGDATATGTGTVTITANAGAIGEWIAGDGTPQYDVTVEGVPDLIVDRTGNDVTIKVRNIEGREVTIEKASGYKALFSTLTTITSSPYVDSGVTAEPKYRAYFSFSGTIGGNPVTYEGTTTRSRFTKE